jgi:HNH endonuclease
MKHRSKNEKSKNCSKCGKLKRIKYFRPRSDKPYLFHSWCSRCEYFAKKKYYHTIKGKQWLKKYSQSRSRKRIKYRFNHSQAGKYSQAKYRKTSGYVKSQLRYRRSYKARLTSRAKEHRRRLRFIKAKYLTYMTRFTIEKVKLKNIKKFGKLTCTYCKKSIRNFHIDHRIPITKKGTNHINNLCIACPCCNFSKNNLTAKQFKTIRAKADK